MLAHLFTAAAVLVAQGICSELAQTQWGQCGGRNWAGPTACATGSCQFSNDWYSQCLGSSGSDSEEGTGADDEGDQTDPDDTTDAVETVEVTVAAPAPVTVASTGGRVITRTITTYYSVGVSRPSAVVSTRVTRITPKVQTTASVRRTASTRTSFRTSTTLVPDAPSDEDSDDDSDTSTDTGN